MDFDGGADILKQFDSRHVPSHVAALLTLKANWLDTLTFKQWGIMINNDVLLFSVTHEETPYEQLLHYPIYHFRMSRKLGRVNVRKASGTVSS